MKKSFTGTQIFVGIITLAVAAAIVAGLFLAGSPEQERMRLADQERLSDLQQISSAMDVYWNAEGSLPPSLDALAKHQNVSIQRIQDPRTGEPYAFTPTGGTAYELCAAFETPSGSGPDQPPLPAPETFWEHGTGPTCFSLQIHPDPSVPKPVPTR